MPYPPAAFQRRPGGVGGLLCGLALLGLFLRFFGLLLLGSIFPAERFQAFL